MEETWNRHPRDDSQDRAFAAAEQALSQGCQDPFIEYIDLKEGRTTGKLPAEHLQENARRIADAMEGTSYPSYRKFFVCDYALECMPFKGATPEALQAEQAYFSDHLVPLLEEAFADPAIPQDQVVAVLGIERWACERWGIDEKTVFDPLFAALQKSHPDSPLLGLAQGIFYIHYAWQARGGDYADKVTDTGWKLFGERLQLARQFLEDAWQADPNNGEVAASMITVAMGQQLDKPTMETWFQRAMKADPDNYHACNAKLIYLLPRWYGSDAEALQFAEDCVAGQNWQGRLPFILRDYLGILAQNKETAPSQAEVWRQLQPVYAGFLDAYPKANSDRTEYARCACIAGDWRVAAQQFAILGDAAWPGIFGGQEKLDAARAEAQSHLHDYD